MKQQTAKRKPALLRKKVDFWKRVVFFLTMEAFGRVHMSQRAFWQWDLMSRT